MRPQSSLESRFAPKVVRSEGCWEWSGGRRRDGYGLIHRGGSKGAPLRAHRVAWELAYGPIPADLCVLHRCDNRGCVRPDHLFLGTRPDNSADMAAKGRSKTTSHYGEEHHNVTLRAADIKAIRERYTGAFGEKAALAREYRVSQTTIGSVLRRFGRYAVE